MKFICKFRTILSIRRAPDQLTHVYVKIKSTSNSYVTYFNHGRGLQLINVIFIRHNLKFCGLLIIYQFITSNDLTEVSLTQKADSAPDSLTVYSLRTLVCSSKRNIVDALLSRSLVLLSHTLFTHKNMSEKRP